MNCDAPALAAASKCFCGFSRNEYDAISIFLLCIWGEENAEHIVAPCNLSITFGPPGTIVLHWINPIAYDTLEVWHVNLIGGPTHIEVVLPGNTTSWQTPILQPGDFFLVRGTLGDDHSGFSTSGPCP